ncbi:MAG: hypothetical protein SFU85_01495 [Candidatus Methylacidiphilales bacterium]|nr:hypothetical protein [Candidatus Methylacidiphilales bacterium]
MPETINQTNTSQIIGGIFSSQEQADKAVAALHDLNISPSNIQIIVKLNDEEAEDTYTSLLLARGISECQALYHNKVVREGNVFVAVYEVEDSGPVIDVFNQFHATFNPNGSRNMRQDVLGMTTGAMVGAAALGAAGAMVAGPIGAVAGAAAGAAAGGAVGVVAGNAIEHRK